MATVAEKTTSARDAIKPPPPQPEQPARKPPEVKLPLDRFKAMGQQRNSFVVVVPDSEFDLVFTQLSYLSRAVHRLRLGDHVEIMADSNRRWALGVVIGVNIHAEKAEITPIIDKTLPASRLADSDLDDLFQIRDNGLHDGFSVVRKADGAVMVKNIVTR